MQRVFGTNWKTTVSGILTGIIATGSVITSFLATQTSNPHAARYSGLVTLICGILQVWVGIISKDAVTPPPPPPLTPNT